MGGKKVRRMEEGKDKEEGNRNGRGREERTKRG